MKAWVLHGINDLRFEDVPKPVLKKGEVLVKVMCAGVCSSDIQRVYVSGAYHYPIILGHEFSGITEDGRRVGVFPLLPCFECESCKEKKYETCADYSYIGSRRDGAFAEYVSVPEWNLIDLPDDVSFEEAALLEPAAVALHAVKMIDLTRVSSVAVVGDGAIGTLITEWLNIYGVKRVKLLGKTDTPEKADVYIEAVGNRQAFETCIENVRANGQIILVGNPSVDFKIEQKLYWQILRKQLTLRGSWNSSFPCDWREALSHTKSFKLSGIIGHEYFFYDLNKALVIMNEGNERKCKVLIDLRGEKIILMR